jgi:purine-cytosine permease-like protein
VLIDAAVVVLAGSFFTVVRQGFLGPFVSFVELLACPIATWAAVLVVDMALRRRRYAQGWANGGLTAGPRLSAVLAWVIGSVLGLCCTASPLFTGPIARGIFAGSSLGYFLGFFVSALIYLVAETAGAWLARRAVRLQGQVQPTG